MEIDWEEGMKMFKTNPLLRPVSVMNILEDQESKRKSRWDTRGDRHTEMNKSMEYLRSFEVDTDAEASTVTNLSGKLAAELKYYTDKVKEQDLLPAKVARAKDVAMSITQKIIQKKIVQAISVPVFQAQQPLFSTNLPLNINLMNNMGMPGGPSGPQIPKSVGSIVVPKVDFLPLPTPPHTFFPANQKQNGQPKPIPLLQTRQSIFNRGPAENTNLMTNMGMSGGTFGLPISILHRPNAAPNMAFPQWPSPHLLFPTNQIQNSHQMPMEKMAEHALKKPSEPSAEDVAFFNKVMGLLSALPQNKTPTDNSQFSSCRSLLDQKRSPENFPANQPLTTASMADRHSSLNPQLPMKMASQNTTSVHRLNKNSSQVASEANNVMPKDQAQAKKEQLLLMLTLLRSRQESGILQTDVDSSLPNKQNLQKQGYGPIDGNSTVLMNRNAYPDQIGDMHMDPLRRDRSYPSRIYNKEDQSSYANVSTKVGKPKYDNYEADQAPYTRIRLSPSSGNERFQDYDSHRGIINRSQERNLDHGLRRSRPFDDPEWSQRESGARHEKRVRLDRDFDPPRSRERGRKHPEGSLANLPADVLKRIQGKDSFTVSAILSEYSESISSK